MERITYRKTLDVHKNGVQFMLQGFQTADNLSRVIEISLMASGDAIDFPLERVVAMMYVTTPDATEPSINKCTIKDNKVVYDVLPIVEEGITKMQLKIIETSPDGATSVLASPEFSVEVAKSCADDGSAEQNTTFTALEDAMAKAKTVYDERFLRMDLDSECIFRAYYADGTYYETDILKKLFLNGNVELSKSYAMGSTGVRVGEDTDNSKYYSNVAKSEALNAKDVMANSEDILEKVKLHGVYTAFSVDFETGEVEYVSPSFKFIVNPETGELDAIGQTYTFNDEVGRVVEGWLGERQIVLSDLTRISSEHSEDIASIKDSLEDHKNSIDTNAVEIDSLKERVTPIDKGGTGETTLSGVKSLLEIDKIASIPSFITFAGNVNADIVSAAFGKGNESDMVGVGKSLVMYSRYKGETVNFTHLQNYNNLNEIGTSQDAINELLGSMAIVTLMQSNAYSKPYVELWKLNYVLPESYRKNSFADIVQDVNVMNYMYNNYETFEALNIFSSSAFIDAAKPYAVDTGNVSYVKGSNTVVYNKKCLIIDAKLNKDYKGMSGDYINIGYKPDGTSYLGTIDGEALHSSTTFGTTTFGVGKFAKNITIPKFTSSENGAGGTARAFVIPCEA